MRVVVLCYQLLCWSSNGYLWVESVSTVQYQLFSLDAGLTAEWRSPEEEIEEYAAQCPDIRSWGILPLGPR